MSPGVRQNGVRYILSDDKTHVSADKAPELALRGLFCQMDALCHFDTGDTGWKEAARYVMYSYFCLSVLHSTSLNSLPVYTLLGYALLGYTLLCCVCRWLKYEEKVEAGDRWSKPHVATTSLHSINEVKRALQEQVVCLDLPAPHGCMPQVSGECVCVCVSESTDPTGVHAPGLRWVSGE